MKNLKKLISLTVLALVLLVSASELAKAQEVEVSTGVDLYSTYVFRGIAYSGPSWQPSVELSTSGFSVGAWGSQGYDGFQEMDLYAGYSFDFGLYVGVTDYWYPGSAYLDGDTHATELNIGYEIDSFSLAGNYIFGGAGSAGDDTYFEVGYSFDKADLFVGAGDGWHSNNGDFALVNIGIGTSKDIVLTDTFTLPVSGAVIFNPDSEQLYILVGFSF